MATVMEIALKTALKPKPVIEIVWRWLSDHPNSDCPRIAAGIGTSSKVVATLLKDLFDRNMLVRYTKRRNVSFGKGNMCERDVFYYTAKGSKYELLPKKKLPKQKFPTGSVRNLEPAPSPLKSVTLKTTVDTVIAPIGVTVPSSNYVSEPAPNITNMPLEKAYALYKELEKYFKGN